MPLLAGVSFVAHLLLAAGLFAPCLTIESRMGGLTAVARALGIANRGETLSVVESIARLFDHGDVVIAVVLFLASVVTPLAKLVVVNKAILDAARRVPVTPWLSRMSRLTKYSLVDVLVVAILIVCARSFPGGTEIVPRYGIYCFAVAAVLPWIVVIGLARVSSAGTASRSRSDLNRLPGPSDAAMDSTGRREGPRRPR